MLEMTICAITSKLDVISMPQRWSATSADVQVGIYDWEAIRKTPQL